MKREEATKVAFGIGAWIHTEGNSVLFTHSQFYEFANAIEARTIERCKQACKDEYVDAIETGSPEDFAYNNALDDAANAIEALKDDQ